MKITRKATQETIPLEDGFLWSDEFDWKPIEQKLGFAIDGTPIIQEGLKLNARSIALVPANQNQGWIKRKHLKTIMQWSCLQEHFTLEFEYPHDKRRFNVIFNHEAGAIEAKPVKEIPTVSEDDYYNVTLRFLELKNDN